MCHDLLRFSLCSGDLLHSYHHTTNHILLYASIISNVINNTTYPSSPSRIDLNNINQTHRVMLMINNHSHVHSINLIQNLLYPYYSRGYLLLFRMQCVQHRTVCPVQYSLVAVVITPDMFIALRFITVHRHRKN